MSDLDLATVTPEDFTAHIGSRFEIGVDPAAGLPGVAEPIPLDLIDVVVAGTRVAGRARPSFSLHFRGPRGLYLRQRIYRLRHAALGTFDLFLVPIAPEADGSRCEAVFN